MIADKEVHIMKLEQKSIIVKRAHKEVIRTEEGIVKLFDQSYAKSDILNEALNQARVEETGIKVAKLKGVSEVEGKWALIIEEKKGVTLAEKMAGDATKIEQYMNEFVDLQLSIQAKKAPKLNRLTDKLANQINHCKDLDETQRYELLTRLDSMPKHDKVCHGDFRPSNIIVAEDGNMTVIDWAHVTQGNASADAAMTYLLFALKDQKTADLYMDLFCKKSGTEKKYVEKWLPIVAASQLSKDNDLQKEFLLKWINVMDFQ